MWLPRNASQQSVCNKSVSDMSVFLFFFSFIFLFSFWCEQRKLYTRRYRLYRRCRASLTQRVEQVLRRQTLHVRLPVCSNGLRSPHVTLATALDLVKNDTGNDDQENAAKRATERNQHDDSIGVMFGWHRVSTCTNE